VAKAVRAGEGLKGDAKVVLFAVVPQVVPAFFAISILCWEINIRESTVLGLVARATLLTPIGHRLIVVKTLKGFSFQRGFFVHQAAQRS
jgi:hypothetical protein